MSEYDTGQVCRAGHPINGRVVDYPHHNQAFCAKCGEPTLKQCETCKANIRGKLRFPDPNPYEPPNFCSSCGAAFPWTLRRISAAATIARESGTLSEAEAVEFEKGLSEISRDTPEGQVAAGRTKRFLVKMGKETAGMVRELIVDIASEATKKVLFP